MKRNDIRAEEIASMIHYELVKEGKAESEEYYIDRQDLYSFWKQAENEKEFEATIKEYMSK